ncbi:MAG TPA: serine/threonine-protein kinase [Thermoanaerobaculia bacterium]|nr:serine/threonine-protein kinase [Thermoanaerobaculia bacterium]
MTDLHPGQIVDGKYEILSLLGAGGMGEVFKVRHVHLNAIRTIKVMRRTLVADETYRNRFAREARLATMLQHPNVALVYDFATLPDGTYYMVSEFIDGVTVRQWATLHGRISPGLAVNIAIQTLHGLEHIHRAGLLHRDLSADNIMIAAGPDGEPIAKIIDLGIAKRVTAAFVADATQAGVFIGNPRYSSPEQLGALPDGEEIDARADLYCLGVVLYEMLAGVAPFISNRPEGYAAKHLAALPPPLLSQPGTEHIPPGLQDVVAKTLEKDRRNRYASAKDFAAALEPYRAEAMSESTQLKIAALHASPQPQGGNATPPTVGAANATASDEMNLLEAIDRLAVQGDVSSLSRLAASHKAASRIGKAVRAALDRMAEEAIPPLGDDERAWLAASEAGTETAWTRYLTEHPDSPRAYQARLRRDELRDYASTARVDSPTAWHSFLEAWPESRYAEIARKRLSELANASAHGEQSAFEQAHATGTAEAWSQFLAVYPSGVFAATARLRLAETEQHKAHPRTVVAPQAAPAPAPAPRRPAARDLPLPVRVAIEAAIVVLVAGFLYFNVRAAERAAEGPPPPAIERTRR